jgi:hypothetical protein
MLAAPCEIGSDRPTSIAKTVSRPFMHLSSFLLLLAMAAVAGCDGAQDIDDVQQRLVGSWLRDGEEDGARVRRVLVLQPGGRFAETSKATKFTGTNIATDAPLGAQGDAVLAQHAHSGDWLFDGTNLKRRYTLIDGRQPSAPTFPYAAFELRFESRNVFIGTDNIRKRQVRYQRVADGTLP